MTERRLRRSASDATERRRFVIERYMASRPTDLLTKKVKTQALSLDDAWLLVRQMGRDPKTGLDRSDILQASLEYEMQLSQARQRPFAVAVVDVDNFKHINSDVGHVMGDTILSHIAQRLAQQIRQDDEVVQIVRWGGEEFVILFPDTALDAAELACRRIVKTIAHDKEVQRLRGKPVTVSIGVTEFQAGRDRAWDTLLTRADLGLRAAKAAGKNVAQSIA